MKRLTVNPPFQCYSKQEWFDIKSIASLTLPWAWLEWRIGHRKDEDHFFARWGEELLITSMALWILSRTGQKTTVVERDASRCSLFFFLSFVIERPSSSGSDAAVYNGTLLWTKRARAPTGSSDAFARGAWKIKDFYSSESATVEMFCILSNAVCWRERSYSENGARTWHAEESSYAHPLLTPFLLYIALYLVAIILLQIPDVQWRRQVADNILGACMMLPGVEANNTADCTEIELYLDQTYIVENLHLRCCSFWTILKWPGCDMKILLHKTNWAPEFLN
jgi:hypothetical protein